MADREHTRLGEHDLYLFNEGTHIRLYEKLGAHAARHGGVDGAWFAVWAPNAERVSVVGDWNEWDASRDLLQPCASSGVWEGFVPGAKQGGRYKYQLVSRVSGESLEKADPFAFHAEIPPRTASVVWDLDYEWGDADWMRERAQRSDLEAPLAIYEVHLGSWRHDAEGRSLSYRELAPQLVEYVRSMGFTHVEFMPLTEHPFYGSWGYQTTGYFAPTSRYGTPQDLMYLVDQLHRAGIGVILDWVPSHFPNDAHGLARFDGTHLFEHEDPRQRVHPDWDSYLFNYGRHEVRSFLLSSALYWLDRYHVDGLRVDAVASMLYLDYSRRPGEWVPNRYGGNENLEAIDFLRRFNEAVYEHHAGVQTLAEESTAWPMVSRPTYLGGLGFGLKWDMGWMHDTLQYMAHDPIHRRFHHGQLTFRMMYAFSENFLLPLSHDEVVHGKGSLLGKMPGDEWQRFANLRLLLGYLYTQPGKKLIFMGGELAEGAEWSHEASLDWQLLQSPPHEGVRRWVRDLNTCYRGEPALHQLDCEPGGFAWIDCNDAEQSTLSWLRRGRSERDVVAVACNFTPVPRYNFRVGVPFAGSWREILNSDAPLYGGSGQGNLGRVETTPVAWHGQPRSLNLTLPPLGMIVLRAPGGDD
jgi:1,4-alpha-glucan branching enzyme